MQCGNHLYDMLVELLVTINVQAFPIVLIHDGVVVVSKTNLGENSMKKINLEFKKMLLYALGISMPIEFKLLGRR